VVQCWTHVGRAAPDAESFRKLTRNTFHSRICREASPIEQDRPQRTVPLRKRFEVQEMLREIKYKRQYKKAA
jgi:hypothetical protein